MGRKLEKNKPNVDATRTNSPTQGRLGPQTAESAEIMPVHAPRKISMFLEMFEDIVKLIERNRSNLSIYVNFAVKLVRYLHGADYRKHQSFDEIEFKAIGLHEKARSNEPVEKWIAELICESMDLYQELDKAGLVALAKQKADHDPKRTWHKILADMLADEEKKATPCPEPSLVGQKKD